VAIEPGQCFAVKHDLLQSKDAREVFGKVGVKLSRRHVKQSGQAGMQNQSRLVVEHMVDRSPRNVQILQKFGQRALAIGATDNMSVDFLSLHEIDETPGELYLWIPATENGDKFTCLHCFAFR
jgi:hypothetical protein